MVPKTKNAFDLYIEILKENIMIINHINIEKNFKFWTLNQQCTLMVVSLTSHKATFNLSLSFLFRVRFSGCWLLSFLGIFRAVGCSSRFVRTRWTARLSRSWPESGSTWGRRRGSWGPCPAPSFEACPKVCTSRSRRSPWCCWCSGNGREIRF